MSTVRIVLSRHNRPARAPDGSEVPDWRLHERLVVLADTVPAKDGDHRAVPLWLQVYGNKELLSRLGRPPADAEVSSGLLETAVRLLRTAGTAVSAVDIEPTSDDEAVDLANVVDFGLGGAVWSTDTERATRVAEQLEVGMANVNTPAGEGADLPFGGTKRSGFGRELGPLGIDEFVNKRLFYVEK